MVPAIFLGLVQEFNVGRDGGPEQDAVTGPTHACNESASFRDRRRITGSLFANLTTQVKEAGVQQYNLLSVGG